VAHALTHAAAAAPGPAWLEEALCFDCGAGHPLVGIVTRPHAHDARLGVLIVVGGPQYRAGSHRHFVQIARELAQSGTPVLRFDVRGMGDSPGEKQGFEDLTPDIGAAIDAFLAACPRLERVVLWGLCDGASAALLYLDARQDTRVAGLALLNPWVRSSQTLAKAQVKSYYAQRLGKLSTWRELLRGRIGWAAVMDFAQVVGRTLRRSRSATSTPDAPLPFQQRMSRAWLRFQGPTLLMLSGRDLTAREFIELLQMDVAFSKAAGRPSVQTQHLPDADHTLSGASARQMHRRILEAWLQSADFGFGPGTSASAKGARP
jgi:uncharacterized protein